MRHGLGLVCALALAAGAHAGNVEWNGDVRTQAIHRRANDASVVGSPRSGAALEANVGMRGFGLAAQALLRHERREGGFEASDARFNELYAAGALPLGERWQWSIGRRIVGWDVGHGWRPNDVVQQEERRALLAGMPQGRPLLQLEHFGASTAWSLVWVNPHHRGEAADAQRGGAEHALALRAFAQAGAVDWHGFVRRGERTLGSVGAAFAWVATDALELHASWRFAQRANRWAFDAAAGNAPAATNPWRATTAGRAVQWLIGWSWTHDSRLGVLAELWHDGSALADAAWDRWHERTAALHALAASAPPALQRAVAGNLAWQATPWNQQNLRRDNLFVRLSWPHDGWHPALDVLFTPADRGRTVTASLAWQGDRLRIEGGVRRHGGPADALLAQLPTRRSAWVAASRAF